MFSGSWSAVSRCPRGVENSVSHCNAKCVYITSSGWPNEAIRHLVVISLCSSFKLHTNSARVDGAVYGDTPGVGVLCVSVGVAVRRKRDLSKLAKNHEYLCVQ